MNSDSAHLVFAVQGDAGIDLIAGQFIRLYFGDPEKKIFRSYSVANALQHNSETLHRLEIAVSWVPGGLASEHLAAMRPGDVIQASGPYGRFCLSDERLKHYVLVATGTGVTPYRAMLHTLCERVDDGARVTVVMGARNASGLLYESDFLAAAADRPGFEYVACLSREARETPHANDCEGHVQAHLRTLEFDPESDIAYLCGNPDMVDAVFQLLKDKGLPVTRIRREKYVSPKTR